MEIRSALFAIALAACGGGGGDKEVAFDTPEAVLAAARERTRAMCACPDTRCRTDVSMRPDDPFGEKARPARDKFTEAQKATWKSITTEWTACSLKK